MQLQYWQRKAVYAPATKRKSLNSKRVHLFSFGPKVFKGIEVKGIPKGSYADESDGSGHFSYVTFKGDYVLGVSRILPHRALEVQWDEPETIKERGYYSLDGKMLWLIFSAQHPELYGVPKVHSMQVNSDHFAYVMDRYSETMRVADRRGLDYVWSPTGHFDWYDETPEERQQVRKLVDTLKQFRSWAEAQGYEFRNGLDLHDDNVMVHKGELYVIDPVGYVYKQQRKEVH